ncbi:hypothetical protein JTE90_004024 [Oedothorax gibbosus]|uniref:Uncharacterized protein n=1 Tax=Oedothorax gibbosus TaxID=931172 RepID=A0AAV6U6D2_9ARAC|nr:hypothetical protein JTE90_004024 [Oedothorax gibbosus]
MAHRPKYPNTHLFFLPHSRLLLWESLVGIGVLQPHHPDPDVNRCHIGRIQHQPLASLTTVFHSTHQASDSSEAHVTYSTLRSTSLVHFCIWCFVSFPSAPDSPNRDMSDIEDEVSKLEDTQGTSPSVLATASSPSILVLKDLMEQLKKVLARELEGNRKLTQKAAFEMKEINLRMFLACSDAVAAQMRAEEEIKTLERLISDKNDQFERLNLTIMEMSANLKSELKAIECTDTLIKSLNLNDQYREPPKKYNKSKQDVPALIIDTIVEGGAKSYRDALVNLAPNFGNPKLTDIIIPRPNRLILKMRNHETLEKFQKQLDSDEKLNKMAQTKISIKETKVNILWGSGRL